MSATRKMNRGPRGLRDLDNMVRAISNFLHDSKKALQETRPVIHTLGLVLVDVCAFIALCYDLFHHVPK
jgi:hypothetical protein